MYSTTRDFDTSSDEMHWLKSSMEMQSALLLNLHTTTSGDGVGEVS